MDEPKLKPKHQSITQTDDRQNQQTTHGSPADQNRKNIDINSRHHKHVSRIITIVTVPPAARQCKKVNKEARIHDRIKQTNKQMQSVYPTVIRSRSTQPTQTKIIYAEIQSITHAKLPIKKHLVVKEYIQSNEMVGCKLSKHAHG